MRLRGLLALVGVLTVAMIGATTAAGGNGNGGISGSAMSCLQGGWQTLARSEDGSLFKNQGDCVLYAAKGGTLTAAFSLTGCKQTGLLDVNHLPLDFLLTGAINTWDNGNLYTTHDRSCGGSATPATLVQAASSSGADAICQPLVTAHGGTYAFAAAAGGDFPSGYWFCVYLVSS